MSLSSKLSKENIEEITRDYVLNMVKDYYDQKRNS
jgi:hypothetical protein